MHCVLMSCLSGRSSRQAVRVHQSGCDEGFVNKRNGSPLSSDTRYSTLHMSNSDICALITLVVCYPLAFSEFPYV